mgnify:CR=1 FL=1
MLKTRIIPCLDVAGGRVVKGVNFMGLRDAGDPIELARRYFEQGADEITFLDVTATVDQRDSTSVVLPISENTWAQVSSVMSWGKVTLP